MVRDLLVKTLGLSFILFLSSCEKEIIPGEDGNDYATVTIGNQEWMAENLNTANFRNGDPIPEVKTNGEWDSAGINQQPAWCYYDNNSAWATKKYGKLYNWYAVNDPRGLAPEGWHIPDETEWDILADVLGGEAVAGTKMKNETSWVQMGYGTNESGFSGIPAGFRKANGVFGEAGHSSNWWSATDESTSNAFYRRIHHSADTLNNGVYWKREGLSVRCIKD
jgi:uncharacterized protein (TIGR02145 family)